LPNDGSGSAAVGSLPVIDGTELAVSKQALANSRTLSDRFIDDGTRPGFAQQGSQMSRTALSLLAATLIPKIGPADESASPHRFCDGIQVYNQAKSRFWPVSIFNFSFHGDATDSEVTHAIESGGALGQLIFAPMELGRTKVSNVALAAPAERLRPILKAIALKFAGERLPYLGFLLIGPLELREDAQTLIEGMGATFIFVPYEDHPCAAVAHSASP